MYRLDVSKRLVADPFKIYLDDIWDSFELPETPGTLINFLNGMKPKFKTWARSHLSEYLAEGLINLYGNIQVQPDFEREALQEGLKRRHEREKELAAQVLKLRERLARTEAKL